MPEAGVDRLADRLPRGAGRSQGTGRWTERVTEAGPRPVPAQRRSGGAPRRTASSMSPPGMSHGSACSAGGGAGRVRGCRTLRRGGGGRRGSRTVPSRSTAAGSPCGPRRGSPRPARGSRKGSPWAGHPRRACGGSGRGPTPMPESSRPPKTTSTVVAIPASGAGGRNRPLVTITPGRSRRVRARGPRAVSSPRRPVRRGRRRRASGGRTVTRARSPGSRPPRAGRAGRRGGRPARGGHDPETGPGRVRHAPVLLPVPAARPSAAPQ